MPQMVELAVVSWSQTMKSTQIQQRLLTPSNVIVAILNSIVTAFSREFVGHDVKR
jgi:hypothetical protein